MLFCIAFIDSHLASWCWYLLKSVALSHSDLITHSFWPTDMFEAKSYTSFILGVSWRRCFAGPSNHTMIFISLSLLWFYRCLSVVLFSDKDLQNSKENAFHDLWIFTIYFVLTFSLFTVEEGYSFLKGRWFS